MKLLDFVVELFDIFLNLVNLLSFFVLETIGGQISIDLFYAFIKSISDEVDSGVNW